MTIQSFKLMNKGPIKRSSDGSRQARIEYLVTSNNVDEDQDAILDHVNCPELHVTGHPDNSDIICRELEVSEYEGNDYKWIVTADFDTRVQFDPVEYNVNNSVVEGGLKGITEDVPTFWDTYGNALVNDAGDYFEGLTKKSRLIACPVTAYFSAVPWALFAELNGTVNDDTITIHGVDFPAGVGLLEEPVMASRPVYAGDGTPYWKVDYNITLRADGWVSILPNRGFFHRVYQTRTTTSDPWEDVGYDAYTAEATGTLKRVIKVAITDDAETDVPSNVWLNDHGEAMLATFDQINSTCSTTANSTTVTSISPTLSADDVGKYIVITGAGYEGRKLRVRIESQGGSTAVISQTAKTTGTGLAMKGGGAWCKVYQIEDLADWSSLPLPNNHT